MAQVVNEPRRPPLARARDARRGRREALPRRARRAELEDRGETAAYTTILNDGRRNGGMIEVAAEMGSDA